MRSVPHSYPSPFLSSYYRWIAVLVREGKRETPQRFRPLAWKLAREPADRVRIWSLYDWIIRYLLAEFREDENRPRHLKTLVERARLLVEERFEVSEMAALRSEVLALAPNRRRRRSHHCHGQIAPDRTLLILRRMLPTLEAIGGGARWFGVDEDALAWSIEMTVAYYVADYDYDHFVMTGRAVADRFDDIARWCQFNMPGDGLDSLRNRPGFEPEPSIPHGRLMVDSPTVHWSRLSEAAALAFRIHADQRRKGTDIPYLSHLLGVASLVMEHGGDEDQGCAALLHDAIEDGGAEWEPVIAERFGPRVAVIVRGCTDADVQPKPPWRARKQAYLDHLETADADVLLVSAADKLHNARAIVSDLRTHGTAVFARFNAGRDGTLWYYDALAATFSRRLPSPLSRDLADAVAQVRELGAMAPKLAMASPAQSSEPGLNRTGS